MGTSGIKTPTVGVFLHIPRTGGTSLRLIMERLYPGGQILPIYGKDIEHPEEAIRRIPYETARAIQMIRGHIPYGIHEYVLWAQCRYFTLMRDPVDRVWSLWNYAKRHKTHHLYGELQRLGTLGAALESGVSTEFNNGMCRQLSGLDGSFPQAPYAKTKLPYGTDNDNALVESVLWHYDQRTVSIGVTEHFGLFLDMLIELFEWKIDFPLDHANRGMTRKPGDISDEEMKLLYSLNMADLAVWARVMERYQ